MSVMQFEQGARASFTAADGSFVNRIDRLVDALVEPVDGDELVRSVLEAMAGLGAIGAILVSLGPNRVVEAVHTAGASRDMVTELGPLAVSEEVPILVAIRSGQPQWVPSLAALQSRFPVFAANAMRGRALASLPLMLSDDVVVGGLGFTFAEPRSFSDTERAFLLTVARIVTAAVVRSADIARPGSVSRYPGAALFDTLRDAVMVRDDATDRLVYANPAAVELFGRGADWLNHATVADLVGHIVGAPVELPRPARLFPGQRVYVVDIERPDGQRRRLEVTVSAANVVGQRAFVAADITDGVSSTSTFPQFDDAELAERERAEHESHDRAVQAVFATSMSLAALSQAVPSRLRDRVESLIVELDELAIDLNGR
jgi:PAS domain-containing protein